MAGVHAVHLTMEGRERSDLAPGLLVAAPPLGDPNFERAVVLLAAHGDDGAFGWVINGGELMTMSELLERAEFSDSVSQCPTGSVRAGGPVGSDQVWLLYPTSERPADLDDQFDLGCGVTASSSRRMLSALANGQAPQPILGVAGYAGWGPAQLEEEIRHGAWLPTDADSAMLFDCEASQLWLRAFERVGTSAIAFSTRVVGSA